MLRLALGEKRMGCLGDLKSRLDVLKGLALPALAFRAAPVSGRRGADLVPLPAPHRLDALQGLLLDVAFGTELVDCLGELKERFEVLKGLLLAVLTALWENLH